MLYSTDGIQCGDISGGDAPDDQRSDCTGAKLNHLWIVRNSTSCR